MDIRINIEPTDEAKQAIEQKYQQEERSLPVAPDKGRGMRIVLLIVVLIYIGIPALILLLLRIPLRIVRQLRKWTAPRKFYRDHLRLYEDEYEWREKPTLEFPERKPTRRAKRQEAERAKRRDELEKKKEELKQAYTGELSAIGNAFDYAVYCAASDYYSGSSTGLCILHQFREKVFDEEGKPKINLPEGHTYGMLCRNISIFCSNLRMPRQSYRFERLAVKHGNLTEKELKLQFGKAFRTLFTKPDLLMEAWDGFEKDLINCWPSPYFTRRVLVATPVKEEKEED